MQKLFNSFSSSKEIFQPFEQNVAKIFICGPTVYDFTHLGHARIFLTYDLLCRHLQDKGFFTDVLVNMTDINENVFRKAKEIGVSYKEISSKYASAFIDDLQDLNIQSINRIACVSDYVESIEREISKLLQQKAAYMAHGNIYLDISKTNDYGHISKQTSEQLSLHLLDIGPGKKNQQDIMLWNCSEDFEFLWNSRFGRGVPWWHMQDTAVAVDNFGKGYDIHGGARELLYPHHEALLAQYKIITGLETPVKTWMHVGLVLSGGEKMSKSLGNVVWVKDLVKKYGQSLIRLYLFSKNYKDDIDFSEQDLISTKPFLDLIRIVGKKVSDSTDKDIQNLIIDFTESLNDDLDSPKSLNILNIICIKVNDGKKISSSDFNRLCYILGIDL